MNKVLLQAANAHPEDRGCLLVLNDWMLEAGLVPDDALPELQIHLWWQMWRDRGEEFQFTVDAALKKMMIDRAGMRATSTLLLEQDPRLVKGLIKGGYLKYGSTHYDRYFESRPTMLPPAITGEYTMGSVYRMPPGKMLLFLDKKGSERLGELGHVVGGGGGWRRRRKGEPIHGRLSAREADRLYEPEGQE